MGRNNRIDGLAIFATLETGTDAKIDFWVFSGSKDGRLRKKVTVSAPARKIDVEYIQKSHVVEIDSVP